jgi:Myb-like DNA-binding domain
MPERENDSDNDEHNKGSFEKKSRIRGHWTPLEDEKLKRLVAEHGAQNWNLLAEKLEGRTGNNEKNNNNFEEFSSISYHFETILVLFL